MKEQAKGQEAAAPEAALRGVMSHSHMVKGVVEQFFYVGAQVGVASFVIRFAQVTVPGTSAKAVATYLMLH